MGDKRMTGGGSQPKVNYGSTTERTPNVGFAGTQFSPTEMFSLSENIASNVYVIHSAGKNLEGRLRSLGTVRDSQNLRDDIQSTLENTKKAVDQTTEEIQKLTSIMRKGDKHQKLRVQMLRESFKDSIDYYSNVQNQVLHKMRTTLLPSEQALIDNKTSEPHSSDLAQILQHEERQKTAELEFETGMLLEREKRMKAIENTVINVNDIMKKLGTMIFEQGELVDRIENAIENVAQDAEAGTEHLEKAERYQSSRRKKAWTLLAISVICGIVLTVLICTLA